MTDDQKDILEDVIDLGGNCLQAVRCSRCPFADKCLPKFAEKTGPWSHKKRLDLAINTLTREVLIGDTYEPS